MRHFGFLPDQPPTLASLFSGGGLADSGFVEAGFRVVWACEIERQPRAVYRRHFPVATMYFDAKEIHGRDVPPVDVLFFGAPCQDLSISGPRTGLAGARSGLFFEAMRIVDEMAAPPAACVWENVSGALSLHEGRDFATVIREMARRWRGVAYRVLDLQFFGVPQRRRRVYVVGHSGGWERAAAILFEPDGLRWNPPARGAARQAVARTVKACARSCDRGDCCDNLIAFGGNNTSGPIDVASRLGCNETGSGYRLDFESDTLIAHALRGEGFDASEDGSGRGTPLVPVSFRAQGQDGFALREVTPPICASDGGASGPPSVMAFPANMSGTQCAHSVNKSLSLGAKNPTAVAMSMAVRRFMPVECERLMGLEDGYTAWGIDDDGRRIELADGPRYKIIGNGVGRPHARWIGRRLHADLRNVAA